MWPSPSIRFITSHRKDQEGTKKRGPWLGVDIWEVTRGDSLCPRGFTSLSMINLFYYIRCYPSQAKISWGSPKKTSRMPSKYSILMFLSIKWAMEHYSHPSAIFRHFSSMIISSRLFRDFQFCISWRLSQRIKIILAIFHCSSKKAMISLEISATFLC